jgi:5-formyltetrahydrofolate cyclo-ligase
MCAAGSPASLGGAALALTEPMEPTVSDLKAALRNRMRAARRAIPDPERAHRSADAARRLFELPALRGLRTVLLFSSFGSEISTAEVVDRLLSEGRRVLLPYLEGRDMRAAELGPGDRLAGSDYGPREPPRRVPVVPAEIDAVIAPGLAFDRHGHRLGYGGGYFDRFLALLGPGPPRVGLCYHEQLIDEVPHGPGDERVDIVITDRETVICEPHRVRE